MTDRRTSHNAYTAVSIAMHR